MDRFWTKVATGESEECWTWMAGKFKAGYGAFRAAGKVVYAHRFSFELAHGEIPDGAIILHSCDNPACVNPLHLRAGTQADNMLDKVDRNRQSRVWRGAVGEKVGMKKLKDSDLPIIRELIEQGIRQADIGEKFGVHQAMISKIKHGKNWAAIQ